MDELESLGGELLQPVRFKEAFRGSYVGGLVQQKAAPARHPVIRNSLVEGIIAQLVKIFSM
jgi:hypothetical protein